MKQEKEPNTAIGERLTASDARARSLRATGSSLTRAGMVFFLMGQHMQDMDMYASRTSRGDAVSQTQTVLVPGEGAVWGQEPRLGEQ